MLKAYKGYEGHVTCVDSDADLITGEVLNLKAVINFQARTPGELQKAFEESVDDYLAWCTERGKEPERPFSGQFIVRVDPDLHRRLYTAARLSGMSLNAWVKESLSKLVPDEKTSRKHPQVRPLRKAKA